MSLVSKMQLNFRLLINVDLTYKKFQEQIINALMTDKYLNNKWNFSLRLRENTLHSNYTNQPFNDV